ncbi:hypothetical protein KP509_1Z204900 [Ceratopteris richardii]|nr:hypothetical protein KP509_1Z204900 [Ceratopteris richardii]
MASSLRLACILVLFVALVVAHSAAFAADMEDKGRKLASDSSGTNERKAPTRRRRRRTKRKLTATTKRTTTKRRRTRRIKRIKHHGGS